MGEPSRSFSGGARRLAGPPHQMGGRVWNWVGAPEDWRPAFHGRRLRRGHPAFSKDGRRPRPRVELARVVGRCRPRPAAGARGGGVCVSELVGARLSREAPRTRVGGGGVALAAAGSTSRGWSVGAAVPSRAAGAGDVSGNETGRPSLARELSRERREGGVAVAVALPGARGEGVCVSALEGRTPSRRDSGDAGWVAGTLPTPRRDRPGAGGGVAPPSPAPGCTARGVALIVSTPRCERVCASAPGAATRPFRTTAAIPLARPSPEREGDFSGYFFVQSALS